MLALGHLVVVVFCFVSGGSGDVGIYLFGGIIRYREHGCLGGGHRWLAGWLAD